MDSYGNMLSKMLVNRLPQEIKLIVNREFGDGVWHIDELMTIVEKEIST